MKTIDSALKELESRGLIKKLCRYRENGSRTSNLYTHEAIIDQTTWELAQAVRQGKRRRTAMGGIDKYSGLLYCADCNSKLYFIRGTTLKTDAYGFICSRYRKHMGEAQCTPHSIRTKVLDEIILEEIRKVTYYARAQTRDFVSFINQKSSAENRREQNAKIVELASLEKQNNELNALFRRLYEDNVLGKVTNEQFCMLSDGYNTEQREITERLPIVKQEIEDLKAVATNVKRFVDIANKYTDLRELTPEVLRIFIERIAVTGADDMQHSVLIQQRCHRRLLRDGIILFN